MLQHRLHTRRFRGKLTTSHYRWGCGNLQRCIKQVSVIRIRGTGVSLIKVCADWRHEIKGRNKRFCPLCPWLSKRDILACHAWSQRYLAYTSDPRFYLAVKLRMAGCYLIISGTARPWDMGPRWLGVCDVLRTILGLRGRAVLLRAIA